jgi:prepilin peptidase CpaA
VGIHLPYPVFAIVVLFVGLSIWWDVRSRRIPNGLSVAGMMAGVLVNTTYHGIPGLLTSLGGLVAMIAALLLPFALGGIGGGDVKMMGAVGAMLGTRLALAGLLVGLVLGGLIMVAHLARVGRLGEKLAATGRMAWLAVFTRSAAPLRLSSAEPGAIALPYSVPLGLGTLAVLLLCRNPGGF